MDLALNNLQRLICHKTQQTKPSKLLFIFFPFTVFILLSSFLLQVQSQLSVNNKEYLLELNYCTQVWLTELEQSTLVEFKKGSVRKSV